MNPYPSNFKRPEPRSIDVLGREYSEVIGYSKAPLIPLGSIVVLMPGSGVNRVFDTHAVGRRAIVLEHKEHRPWSQVEPLVKVQYLSDLNDWEPWQNRQDCVPSYLFIEKLGTGTAPVPGVEYPLTKKEFFDAKWKTMDHRHQDWTNPMTFLAHTYLRTDAKHYKAVEHMRRADGTVNPKRLQAYFSQQPNLWFDEWALYPEGFPPHEAYRYLPNWVEVAKEFNTAFKEQDSFAQMS